MFRQGMNCSSGKSRPGIDLASIPLAGKFKLLYFAAKEVLSNGDGSLSFAGMRFLSVGS
jgi:hypothetical protein